MNDRKRLTLISVLEIAAEADPWSVPEDVLSARACLRPPKPTPTEVKDACVELETRHKAIARDVAPVTESVRLSATPHTAAILRALREG